MKRYEPAPLTRSGRLLAAAMLAGALICVLAAASLHAQSAISGPRSAQTRVDGARRALRTPWGDPDLQGTWSNQTLTPLERPAEFANKPVMTETEAAEYEKRLLQENDADVRTPGTRRDVNTAYNNVWWDRGNRIVADRRTSLVIDPPDGKIPALTAAGRERAERERQIAGSNVEEHAASWLDFDVYSRCIIRSGLPRLSTGYNNNYEIVQTPGYVAIFQEQIHETRIIPLNTMPHLLTTVRQWLGDSRGHWDGDTLVVETTNFSDEARGSIFRQATKNLVLVEKWKRIDDRTIDYQFTVSDPDTWTRPWTVKMPWNRIDGLVYEYACHEGNLSMQHMLEAARAAEKQPSK